MILHSSKVGYVRKTVSVVLAAAFVLAVAGCSDIPQTITSCTPSAASGAASDAIDAAGKFGQNPDAKVPTPTVTKKIEVTAIDKGKGQLLGVDDIARLQYTIYSGATGNLLGSTGQSGYKLSTAYQSTIGLKKDPIGKTLVCQRVGSRVATVLTAAQFFGAAQATSSGLKASDVLVVIADIEKGYRGRATGILQPLKSGFPSVVTAPDGTPGLTFDLQSPPKTLQYEVIRKGSGATTKEGDTLLLQIQGVEWTNPAPTDTFFSTWTSHQPVATLLASAGKNAAATLDPGSVKGLTGQTVGSQIIVVVPPKFGYPKGVTPPSGYPTGSTLVFVYDILGIE
ncbi:MAG: peptidylprolyl isomerase [Glaciihabitans sp.]|nr:peptidylprolyl isomerase [Glaciihabitans sp.]MDQ1570851.1 hypothetical protein [Actinomycetota bacterium]